MTIPSGSVSVAVACFYIGIDVPDATSPDPQIICPQSRNKKNLMVWLLARNLTMRIYIDTKLCELRGNDVVVINHGGYGNNNYPLKSFTKKFWACSCRNLSEVDETQCYTCKKPRPDDWEMTIKTLEVFAGRVICSEG